MFTRAKGVADESKDATSYRLPYIAKIGKKKAKVYISTAGFKAGKEKCRCQPLTINSTQQIR